MTDLFKSPKQLISHARDEINDLEARLTMFFNAKPYAHIVDVDSQTGEQVHKIKLTSLPPEKFGNIAKDAAGNLRDALDHAVYAATVALKGGDPRDTGFPFANTDAGVKGELASKRLSGNAPEIRPFLAALNPHERGNPLLWGLNQIRNPNTHRVIVPVGHAAMGSNLFIRSGQIRGGAIGYNKWDAAKNEVEFMRLSPDSQIDYEVTAAFDVLFEGAHPLSGKPVVRSLREIAAEVERIVAGIEAETARIAKAIAS